MAKFKIKIDMKKIKATEEQIIKGVQQGLEVCAEEIAEVEQKFIEITTGKGKYTPTGQLKNSVTIMPLEWSPYGASITVVPTVDYATYVNEGTGEHHPQGRPGGWIYTPDGVSYFFTWGIRPHYFADKTYDYIKPKAKDIVAEQIYKCIR